MDAVDRHRRLRPAEGIGVGQLQRCDPGAGPVGERLDRRAPPVSEPLDPCRIEQVGPVLDRRGAPVVAIDDRQRQVELRGAGVGRDLAHLDAGEVPAGTWRVLQDERYLDQRAVAEGALRRKRLDQVLERKVGMVVGV